MVLWAAILVIHGASLVGCMPSSAGGGMPENITIMFLSPSEVKVSWKTAVDSVDKYDVTYKPTDARVVVVVAGNSEAVTLTNLKADTQYSVTITALRAGKKFKSRPVVFRTLALEIGKGEVSGGSGPPKNRTPSANIPPPYLQSMSQVRGIEIGIVCLVLVVWVGSIGLFFNRWGKIRMLLPYQPDYKDTQLKVPGTSQALGPSCQSASASAFCCPQRYSTEWGGGGRRWRIHSAIHLGGEEGEPLCEASGGAGRSGARRARSAEHLASTGGPHSSRLLYSPPRPLPVLSVSVAHDSTSLEHHL